MTQEREPLPLWRVMFDAGAKVTAQGALRTTPEAKAAEIRALHRYILPDEPDEEPDCEPNNPLPAWLWRERQRLRALLIAEAERAESKNPEL